MTGFRELSSETRFAGHIGTLRVARFRYDDGGEAQREIVAHPGAAAAVVLDGDELLLIRQPREAVGEPALLELPAGKLDPGESALQAAKRELAEEIGRAAERWEHLVGCYSSPGFTDERIEIFLAHELREVDDHEPDGEERIELERWPLAALDELIDTVEDAKTLVGLMAFARRR